MNVFEKFVPVLNGFPSTVSTLELRDGIQGFTVILSGSNDVDYLLKFNSHVLGYRLFDEGDRFRSKNIYEISPKEWALFKSNATELIEWLNSETFSKYDNEEIFHFIIITKDYILDIIAFDDPIITTF